MVAAWRDARHFFPPKEQAAPALTEEVTRAGDAGVPDAVYAEAAIRFEDAEPAHLLALILASNTWNRVALATGMEARADERRR